MKPSEQEQADGKLLQDFVRRRNHDSFERLMKRHANMVYGVCWRILGNHHEAEDVTQAVFVHLARHAKKLSRDRSVAGWLHTVAKRFSLNALRSGSRRKAREKNAVLDEEISSNGDDPKGNEDLRRELDEAIAELPERYRVPLVLFHFEECSLAQVAEQLSTKPSTIGTRLSRARDMLRASLSSRGVAVGSVSALLVMLSAEAKAAVMPASSLALSVDAVLGEVLAGSSVGQGGVLAAKTDTLIRTAAVVAVLGVAVFGLATYRSLNSPTPDADGGQGALAKQSPRQAGIDDARHRGAGSFIRASRNGLGLSGHTPFTAEWMLEVEKAFAMQAGPEQLAAIRSVLGMPISDSVYDVILNPTDYKKRNPDKKLELLLAKWAEEDPQAMMEWGKTSENEKMTMCLLAIWVNFDAESARAYAQEHFSEEMLEKAEQRALGFTRFDMEQIQADIEQYGELGKRDPDSPELFKAIRNWSLEQPAEAAAYLLTIPATYRNEEGRERELHWRSICMGLVMEEWAGKDPDAALEWVSANLPEDERNRAYEIIVPSLALKYPADEIDISGLPKDSGDRITFQLVKNWTESDPMAALDFSLNLEDESLRSSCASEVIMNWHMRDPDAAQTWILKDADPELRDTSLSKIAEMNCRGDLSTAKDMLTHIEDGELKYQTGFHILTFGLKHNKVPEMLEVMDQMGPMHAVNLVSLAGRLEGRDRQELNAFRSWVEEAHADGTIRHEAYDGPAGASPEAIAQWESQQAAKAYESIMDALDQAAQADELK